MMRIEEMRGNEDVTIKLVGDLDPEAVETCRRRLCQVVNDNGAHMILDLSELNYTFSGGLAVFIELASKLRRSGGDLCIVHPPNWLRHMLSQTGLDRIMSVMDGATPGDARSSANRAGVLSS